MYTGKSWLRYSTICFRWWRIKQKKANPRTIQRNRIDPTTERATVASLLKASIGDRFGLELVDTRKYSKTISLIASVKLHYCSFKIFPQFWLAKSTRINHHNQLLMTKFGRILRLTRKRRQKWSPLQVKALLPRRPGDEVKLFLAVKKKMANISLVSRAKSAAGTRRNDSKKHGKNSKKTTRRATSAIWRIFAELDKPKRTLSKMNLTSMDRWR